jgi:hypothetical protein
MPDRELAALKASVVGVGSIGRNLNQIARVANQTGTVTGLAVSNLWDVLRACEALRVHTKALIKANIASWESGDAEAPR